MDQSIKKKYNYWQWRTLILLMIGYALFYFVRKNFSITMPALEAELGINKAKLGLFLTLNGVIYGVSRFVNGFLADRVSRKKMMAAGLFLSAVVNILIGFSVEMNGVFNFLDAEGKATAGLVVFIGSLWLINGYTQGMGYPPCGSLMAHWIKPSELAFKQSIWNSSHSIGAGLVSLLCGSLILQHYTYASWQWCFFVPALLAIAGSLMLLLGLKDTPASVGLPDPETLDEDAPAKEAVVEPSEFTQKAYKRLVDKMVFKNPIIWILAISNFCVYVIRFTILDWGASFLTQDRGMAISSASTVIAASELAGGIVGTLIAGWATDKFFKSKSHRTCLIGLVGATICFVLFWLTPKGMTWMAVTCIIMASFFVYMPQALIGIACSNHATKRVAASANGVAGIFGYASTTVSGLAFGIIADKFGWNSVFEVAIAFGVIGIILLAVIWKAPADGYEKANAILDDLKGEMGQ
jgi:Sugar phosphate permease